MIFDDLINIKLYKGIHPNLDQAIDFLYEHRKDSFELGRYDIDSDKVFLVVQENTLNKDENDRFEHHRRYADLHEASDIGFVHCEKFYPLHLGYHNFAVFFPHEPHQPNGYSGQEETVRKYLFKIAMD